MTIAGLYFELSTTEWIIQILVIGLIMTVEGINSAIEEIADFIHPEYHKKIGLIKDISAGAVFIFAITAHKNDVAMILIEPPKKVYKNENARKRLKRLWKKAYSSNIKKLMPHWVNELENERIPYQGIKMLSM